MSNSLGIGALSDAILKELENYTDGINSIVKKAVDETATGVNKVIKNHCTFGGSGEYVKAFKLKSTGNGYSPKKTWYVDKPHYRLTHLLENGHAKRGGGRVKAFPHIKYGEEYAVENLEKKIIEGIENGT